MISRANVPARKLNFFNSMVWGFLTTNKLTIFNVYFSDQNMFLKIAASIFTKMKIFAKVLLNLFK